MTEPTDTRVRIVEVAARLLREQGPAGVTTRGVAEEAGVQAPTIYRLFGDKDGLLEAVAEHVMADHVAAKSDAVSAASGADVDPVDDLRAGWDQHLAFGLANPALFTLLSDPARAGRSAAVESGRSVLAARVHRVALAARLRVGEQRAVDLIHAAGTGAVLAQVSTPPERRDPGVAAAMYEAVLAQILTDPPSAPAGREAVATVVAFRALAPELQMLTGSERGLLTDWLDRVVDGFDEHRDDR